MTISSDIIYKQDPVKLNKAALNAFFNIINEWKLSNQQAMVLLGIRPQNRSTFYRWKRHPERAQLSKDKLERISYLLGIYKALVTIYPSRETACTWLLRSNQAYPFNGQPALKIMLAGNVSDLYEVRKHLDARKNCK